jgi:protein TonB
MRRTSRPVASPKTPPAPDSAALPPASEAPSPTPGQAPEQAVDSASLPALAPQPAPPAVDLAPYRAAVHRAVQAEQRYPRQAARRGIEGRALVLARVDRAGELLGAPELRRSAAHPALDAEAVRMVEAAAPFPPLPGGWPDPELELSIPVLFSVKAPPAPP